MRNLALKYGPRVAAGSTGVVASFGALAEAPAAFTAAVTTVTASGVAMATALVVVAAAIVAIMIAVKFVKRIRGAV